MISELVEITCSPLAGAYFWGTLLGLGGLLFGSGIALLGGLTLVTLSIGLAGVLVYVD